ncbi:MAG: tRNA dihydrouridine synthase [Bdellovibrionales bacterium]
MSPSQLDPSLVKLSLAPMEGVMDWAFRDLITELGGVDQVTTEFIRVTKNLHPNKVFHRYAPELFTGSHTRSGVPLFVQLLGGEPEPMAANAARAAELGAVGIDLNFGCPAKTVNRHDGGASLLRFPHRLEAIVRTVRQAVPASIPVTAKMRLGFEDTKLCLENAKALEAGGASRLTVHCRTKLQGYKPPAHWEWLAQLRETIDIPIVGNGDIVDRESLQKCWEISRGEHFMIGRAALRNPQVFLQIRQAQPRQAEWSFQRKFVLGFYQASRSYVNAHFAMARTKQLLRNLTLDSEEAREIFDQTKALLKPLEFESRLETLLQ